MSPAQVNLDKSFLHDANNSPLMEWAKAPSALALSASQSFVHRELAGRVIIVIVIESSCYLDISSEAE